MTFMSKQIIRPLVMGVCLIGFIGIYTAVAHAQADGRDQARGNSSEDSVSAHDRAEYAQNNFEQRFGVHFNSHTQVCTESGAGDAHCNARVITDSRGNPSASPKIIYGMGPAQLVKAYGLSGVAAGSPVIAIVDAYDDPNITNDLATYSAAFGIPKLPTCSGPIASATGACFQKVSQSGSTTRYPMSNAGWSLEIALDVEMAHATCQNCKVLLVEANSASYNDLMSAVDRAVALGASVVSNSYGGGEFSGETAYDSHFNHPGVAFTFAAGDAGYGTEYPAASKYVTAVGGTSLFLNPDGSYKQEIAWSGTGSGCSAFESKPVWQTDAKCAKRTVADVAADADPNTGAAVYDSVRYAGQSGWFQVGGTSLATPIIAGVYALSGNLPTTSSANALPYAAAPLYLNDIATGSNGSCGSSYLCTALAGYDGPTGLGSPKGVGAF